MLDNVSDAPNPPRTVGQPSTQSSGSSIGALAWNGTRQIEFAKEIPQGQRYGNILLSPPADWTYLRIVKRALPGIRRGELHGLHHDSQ